MDISVRPVGEPGDLEWVAEAHGEVYTSEFGWSHDFEAFVTTIVADYAADHDPAREAGWIAERDGQRVGCVFCVDGGGRTAKLRTLLVTPQARGSGLGSTLVKCCVEFARDSGYERIMLWTNSVLTSARHVYEHAGFTLVDEQPHHSFGVDLIGQTWELHLK
jgi:N-acetylglutamate synthase-like GNAT family acetyltransferase